MKTDGTGVSHYFEPLFGVFGFVPNNQNTVLAQFFQALGNLFESIPCSSTFLLLPSEEYKKELVKIFSFGRDTLETFCRGDVALS